MGQVLHGSATTTEAVRRAIQNSQESLRALSKRYGINQTLFPDNGAPFVQKHDAANHFLENDQGGSWKMSNDRERSLPGQGDKTSGRQGSGEPPRIDDVPNVCRSNIQRSTCGSSVPDQWKGGPSYYKNPGDVPARWTGQQTCQWTDGGDHPERVAQD